MQNRSRYKTGSHIAVDIDGLLYGLNRFMPSWLPLRHRHVLTRRDTVRLRFMVLPGAGMAVLFLTAASLISPVMAVTPTRIIQTAATMPEP
ncbi:MAG TPA: hypothetical protein VIF12_01375, partial [Micavibrio sp.]